MSTSVFIYWYMFFKLCPVLFFTNEYGYLVLLMMKRCEESTSYSEHCQVFRTVVFILLVFKFVSKWIY